MDKRDFPSSPAQWFIYATIPTLLLSLFTSVLPVAGNKLILKNIHITNSEALEF